MDVKAGFYLLLTLAIVLCPLVLSFYVSNLEILSIYGITVLLYTCIQIVFSSLNRIEMNKICAVTKYSDNKYNILIVGYREDKDLFTKCLKSHKVHLFNPNVNRIIVVIDGNEEEDFYMGEIFKNIFTYNGKVYRGGYPQDITTKAICILQEHRGKRHALYTGLDISCMENVEGVVCTDSDTEMDKKAVEYLIQTLEHNENTGAVTGMMNISNKNSFISFMSFIRYWFACNLERAYQSYNGVVLCVSGPIGIYRTSVIRGVLKDFVNQTFMGKECTYGDDRHLTNKILQEGYDVKYNHLVTCSTDTPENIMRFFSQQTRWCKSSYRELLWTLKHIHLHSFWMTVDIVYQTIYSLIVTSSLIYILTLNSIRIICYYLLSIIIMNLVKGVYASVIEKNPVYMNYSMYGFVYILYVVPSKIYAGLTLSDTSWGTSSRKNIFDKINYGHVFMISWITTLCCFLVYNIVSSEKNIIDLIILWCIIFYTFTSFVCIKLKERFY